MHDDIKKLNDSMINKTIVFKPVETTYTKSEDVIGEVEFFDLMKRANRDLNGHERWIVWTITKRLLRGEDDASNR